MNVMNGFSGKIQVGHKYQTERGVARCVDDDIVGDGYKKYLLIVRVKMSDGRLIDQDIAVDECGNAGKREYDVEREIEEMP